ncbi:MAG TPA: hypothetical protein ENN19_00905 [Chloroflexi bacterium]|nr:hypothetical protein [Chloroflexota bacterium]
MSEKQPINAILVADCGTVTTKAVLLEQVSGHYRFIARGEALTTTAPPWSDVSEGVRRAIGKIAQITGRHFFDVSGDLILPATAGRQGVDAFVATASAAEPLGTVLGGLVPDLSVASAKRAAAGTYSVIHAILSSVHHHGSDEASHVHAIREAAPDVICIAGGTDGGATYPVLEMVKTVALACSMIEQSARPRVLYMGNPQLRRRIVRLIKGQAELRVTDNVRPELTRETLASARAELETLYTQKKMSLLPGIDVLNSWSSVPLMPTANAFSRLMQYLWHLGDQEKGVIGIDVGAAHTTLSAIFNEVPYLTINGGVGAAFGGRQLLQKQGFEALTQWMPESMGYDEIMGLLINKEMRPHTISQELDELRLEQALVREAIRATLQIARPGWQAGKAQIDRQLLPLCETIVVSGSMLTQAPQPGQTALMVIDALEPIGVTTLVMDVHGIAPALGSVATVKPLAAVEALDRGALVNLATVVAPVGRARLGDLVLKARLTYEDDGTLDIDVHYGDLETLPLQPGKQAVLELKPVRRHGFDVGFGGPGKGGKQKINGGLAGLIIDARGRPLRLPRMVERRQEKLRQWLWDVGG